MKITGLVLTVLLFLVLGALIFLPCGLNVDEDSSLLSASQPAEPTLAGVLPGAGEDQEEAAIFRIALVPERDIFAQRRRFLALADYLSLKLNRKVTLVTLNTYQSIMKDMAEKRVDAAFLGSLVAVLAIDRLDAQVLVKPELPDGASTYRGVIFVPENSPVRKIEDLAGRTIAMVRTTMAGELFPYWQLKEAGLLKAENSPRIVWVGTHDDVIYEVMAGRVDAGAVKDLRLIAFAKNHPDQKFRQLAISDAVPNDGLVLRPDIAQTLGPQLRQILLAMDSDPQGQEALKQFGALRFLPCAADDYQAIFTMVHHLDSDWMRLGLGEPHPRSQSEKDAQGK
ncbi:MAG: phosphate/phosphite/phosphonate ABC transporter substrate-binding protein [Phycisphaeraceae bacterium]|nr:phosphate/phosphite/phosphonate ABC transporter substrate-binding protein [Phycisphaeraceae bacterium]